MARVLLATQSIAEPALNPAYTAGTDVGATYTVEADADYVEIFNGNAGTIVVTVETGGVGPGGFALADKAVTAILTTQRRKIPLRDKRAYPRPSGASPDPNRVYVNLDIVASVTAGAFKL